MPQTPTTTVDDATEAREATAARLERLARLVRNSPTTDIQVLDEAYSEIVKLSARLRALLALY
jgi:hypothetical protein